MISRWLAAYAGLLLRRRYLAMAVLVSLLVAAAAGVPRIVVDFNTEELFASDDPSIATLERFKAQFGRDDIHLAVIARADDVTTPAALAKLDALQRDLEAVPDVSRVRGLMTASDLASSDEAVIDASPLFDPLPRPGDDTSELRRRATTSPLIANLFINEDATVAALIAELDLEDESIGPLSAVVDATRAVVAEHHTDELQLDLGGIPFLRADSVVLITEEQLRLTGTTFPLLVLLLVIFFRSVHGTVVPLLAVSTAAIALAGLMGWLGISGDMINLALPSLILVIGVSDAIHLVVRFHEEQRRGNDPEGAARAAVGHVGYACLLTTATTTIGFLSLYSADMDILRKFGGTAAMGVGVAYLMVMGWVPVLLTFVKPGARPSAVTHSRLAVLSERFLGWADGTTRKHPRLWVGLGLGLAIAGGAAIPTLEVDARITSLHPRDHPVLKVNRIFEDELSGAVSTAVMFEGEPGALIEPDVLERMNELGEWLLERDEVRVVMSPASFIAEMHGAYAGERRIPDNRQAVAQLLLLAEGDSGLDDFLDPDHSIALLTASGRDVGATNHQRLLEDLSAKTAAVFEGAEAQATVTGTTVVAYRAIVGLVADLFGSILWAFGLILLVMFPVLRSLRLGLLSLIPNLFPLLIGAAAMALFGIPVEPATTIVFAVALGIAVDDTIHFLSRYREEKARGRSESEAITITVKETGRAMLYTTVILCLGFSVTISSVFPPLSHFGVLGAVILAAALLGDLFVLPACMHLFRARQK